MDDYNKITELIQSEISARYLENHGILNHPGKSLACKIDPLYYLALPKAMLDTLAQWTGMSPEKISAALVRTGNMISSDKDRNHIIPLRLKHGQQSPAGAVNCCLLSADFIDRALIIYAGVTEEPPISPLKIHISCKEALNDFLNGKPALAAIAYSD